MSIAEMQASTPAVEAVCRQFLELTEERDPSVGLNPEPFARQVRQLVMETPVLMERAFLSAARNALVEEHHRRVGAGESPEEVAADAPARVRSAFGLVEKGLKDYAVKPPAKSS